MLRFVFAFCLAFSAPALAAEFDVTAPILDLDGKPVKDGESILTSGRVAIIALTSPYQDEQNLAGEEKVKRFAVALKIQGSIGSGQKLDLTVDELALIKKLVGKGMAPLVVGRVWEMIDKK